MKIYNLNVNDFGGKNNHLEEYKELYGARWCMNKWDKEVDKTDVKEGILNNIDEYMPDLVIFQEFDINSNDATDFKNEMETRGYLLCSEITGFKRPSMTVFFIKNELEYSYINTGHHLNGRAYAVKVKDTIIYGTHVPPKYNGEYWDELESFIENLNEEKYILIGDFNTINYKNNLRLINMLKNKNVYDVWEEKGNSEPISIMGDYVIASNMIRVDDVDISSYDTDFSDHPIVKFELKCV